jgi:putative membrane protein
MAPLPPTIGSELLFGVFPFYFVYTLIIILLLALIFYWLIRNEKKKESPLELLKRRYAGGEIDSETFKSMKKDLADTTNGGTRRNIRNR